MLSENSHQPLQGQNNETQVRNPGGDISSKARLISGAEKTLSDFEGIIPAITRSSAEIWFLRNLVQT